MKTTKGQREALRKWCSATYGVPVNGELAKAVLALLDVLEEVEAELEHALLLLASE